MCRHNLKRERGVETNIMVGKRKHIILKVITERIYIQIKLQGHFDSIYSFIWFPEREPINVSIAGINAALRLIRRLFS